MVHAKVLHPLGAGDSSKHLIRLDEKQASAVPFPRGCPVVVIENGLIRYSGEVSAVYISFALNSGSCQNWYEIIQPNKTSTVVSGAELRYGLGCPIIISANIESFDASSTIEGVIKGFEVTSEEHLNHDSNIPFVYTVEVSAIGSNNLERVFRHRGIKPENIRYRCPFVSYDQHQTQEENDVTSVVSLDGAPSGATKKAKLDHPHDPFMNSVSLFLQATEASETLSETSNEPSNATSKEYRRCTPLSQPWPICFEGDFEAHINLELPDFSALTNFHTFRCTGARNENKGICVMCGELRDCQGGKSLKTKQMKTLLDKAQDIAVIPNQNKGMCTNCDVNIWVVNSSGLQIKWCKGCKNFQTWASFGEKGHASKCISCREKQKEKYAASKAAQILTDKLSMQLPMHAQFHMKRKI